jgi:site-specific recombinase XerD
VSGELVPGDTKTGKHRLVTLVPTVAAELRDYIVENQIHDPDAYLFMTPTGTPLRNNNFRKGPLEKAVDAAGVKTPVTTYTFRHTAASLLAQAGVTVSVAAAMLRSRSRRVFARVRPSLSDRPG